MDVRRLRLLRELADRGTVTAVAAALSYTPSAVSQQLRALQAEVGVQLTEPAGRGLRLTDAGRALAARADEVLAALDRAEAELDSYRSTPRGVVRLAIFPSGAFLLLPGLLRRMAAHPEVRLECRDVDMTPAEVPGLTADFDLVVTHREAMERCGNRRPRVERLVSAWNQGIRGHAHPEGEDDDPLIGASAEPKQRPRTRLTDEEVDAMRTVRERGIGVNAVARQFGVHRGTVWAKTR